MHYLAHSLRSAVPPPVMEDLDRGKDMWPLHICSSLELPCLQDTVCAVLSQEECSL